jgi:signal transduction histidine kinase
MAARNRDNHSSFTWQDADPNRIMGIHSVYSELIQFLGTNLAPADLIKHITEKCCNPLISSCAILRLTGNDNLPSGVFIKAEGRINPLLPRLLEIETTCAEESIRTAATLCKQDLFTDNSLPCSCIIVPLKIREICIGAITFFGRKGNDGHFHNYDSSDQKLLEELSILISSALSEAGTSQHISLLTKEHDKQFKEFSLLYRLSNTMLSTIQLNKLIHLTLTALISGSKPFFDRAMLFLINPHSMVMQGMLGATCETPTALTSQVDDEEDILASRWDLTEEEMTRQRQSDFNRLVMASRIELNKTLNVSSKAVLEKKLIYVPNAKTDKRVDRSFVSRFGIKSFAVSPLMARDRVVGAIVVDNAIHGGPITKDDLRFLQLFANQAGMAIENSILYNRVEDTDHDLREAQARLHQGERLATIGEMAAGIAHELKSPLVAIGGFATRLAKKLAVPSVEWEYADLISREVVRLEKMLSDILIFSKKATICYTECNITDIVRSALAVTAPSMQEDNISIKTRFPKKVLGFPGDCEQLKQVFLNLFSNAHEAMKEGGTLNISVSECLVDGKKSVAISIADTGGGIPLEALHTIFTPFYTTKDSGTGLGLPIANRIITNHGGKIHVKNRPGIGVEFNVIIPLQV